MSDDKMAKLLDSASKSVRAALHAQAMPEYPSDLYTRCGSLVEILGRLSAVAGVLVDHIAALDSQAALLASDDDTSASDHAETARAELTETINDLAAASAASNLAFSGLSHLKLNAA